MKRFATKSFVLAAALAAVAVGASAQSLLKAEIPFTFRAGEAVLAAGSYRVHVGSPSNHNVIRLTNVDTKKSTMILSQYRNDVGKAAGREPKLWFGCSGSNCVLTTVWNGMDSTAHVTGSVPRAGKEMAEIRVVNLTAVKAE